MPSIDLGLALTAYNHATKPIRDVGDGLDDLGKKVKKVGENSQEAANRLKAIEVVIGGILLEKVTELGKKFLELASASQNADARLAAWVGSTEEAEKILRKLNDTVGASGVKLETMSNSIVKLRASGVGVGDTTKTIQNMVDGIAAVGGGNLDSKLEAATTAFQRFAAKGVVSTRELNAIVSDTGLTVGELAKAGGVSITEFYEQLKDKTTGAQVLLDDFNRAAEQKFGGFSKLLANTVGGALSKFKNDVALAFSALAEQNGGVNVELVAFLQNLDTAVVSLIHDVAPGAIRAFFQYFEDAAPVLAKVIDLLIVVAKGALLIGDTGFKMLGALPDGALEYGLIGFLLFGKKGALIGGLIGAAEAKVRSFGKSVDNGLANAGVAPEFFRADAKKLDKSTFEALLSPDKAATPSGNPANNWLSKLVGTPEQIKAIEAELDKLKKFKFAPGQISDAPGNPELQKQLDALRAESANTIAGIAGKDEMLQAKTAGDDLKATIDGIAQTSISWVNQLELARTKIDASKLSKAEIAKWDDVINTLEGQIAQHTQDAVVQAQKLNELKKAELEIDRQIATIRNNETARQIQTQLNQRANPLQAVLSGTPGGQVEEQVLQQKASLTEQILGYHKQIDGLMQDELLHSQNKEGDDKQIASLQNLIDLTQQFHDGLTADVVMQNQLLQELGDTLNNDIASGISGIIQGTQTWGDVGRKIFGDLIDMAVKYIIKLAEMKLLKMAIEGGLGFADGGVMPGSVTPFANGGVPGVTKFANGGLTNGPTMFGLMGEAGTEAIMPLTRVNGKLGVHSSGGGGDNYHITIQAQDTQSGMEFISKHIDFIHGNLQQRKRLNLARG